MTDPNPLREDEVEALTESQKAVLANRAEGLHLKSHSLAIDVLIAKGMMTEDGLLTQRGEQARAAITALDQVREGRK